MILEQIKKAPLEDVQIFSGAGVDPDGLASAWALKLIVEALGGKASCFYRGSFNRPQNKAMREVLGLGFFRSSSTACNSTPTTIISVDGPQGVCPKVPHFIIDHHKQDGDAEIASDVRQTGACASIVTEYARQVVDFNTETGRLLATALLIGILTDTNYFQSKLSSQLDYDAISFLLPYKDDKTFVAVMNCPMPEYYHEMYAEAWQNRRSGGTLLIFPLGDIPRAREGVISYLAEKFGATDGCSTSIAVAMVENEIIMSVRNYTSAIDVDEFAKSFGLGGGKSGAGVAKIPMPELLFKNVSNANRKALFDAFFAVIVDKAIELTSDGPSPKDSEAAK